MLYRYATLVAALLTCSANSQTLVDLRTQSKSVDFSGANSTKPFKTGTVLPATCLVGELFFKTNAPAGSNTYACTSVNSWTLQSSGGGSGLSIATSGTTQGTRPTLNFTPANGITQTCTDNAGLNRVDCAPAADTSVLLTRATDQASTDVACVPAGSSSTAYTCNVIPALVSQAVNGSRWIFTPDVNCGANPTLNISGRGAVSLRKLSGGALINLVANDCIGGVPYQVIKTASAFVLNPMAVVSGGGSLTIEVGGVTIGSQAILNFDSANGITQNCTNNVGGSRVDCSPSFNGALVATHDSIHANENFCASSNGTTAYTCALQFKALTGYITGMIFGLYTDATCTGSCSVDIDNLGSVAIKRADGINDPQGLLVANQLQWVFYDGTVFRMVGGVPPGGLDSITYASTISLDVTVASVHKTTTVNATGNTTINASSSGTPGQHMSLIIVNDSSSGKTITFGANFRSSGTLAGTASKAATIQFVSDGTSWFEISRTLAL